ncbi:hypothetical protein CLCR_06745 [Cladophialophora carrionii]|uniref:DUF2264 domain-containing protein n=1 Tax=Cladophialophora carrionii TaxID=86049 RepID=A0A1C1CPC0_9EURO|nr:hypothetical protein CLCR_06745 [Cladophialophora carrionii]
MPPFAPFNDNPFRTRNDLLVAATAMLEAIHPYFSPQSARVRLSTSTGAGFDPIAAELEGYARPLWLVADLLALGEEGEGASTGPELEALLQPWTQGLRAGTDPNSSEYWGDLGDFDQRMVEMEPIAYAVVTVPRAFLAPTGSGTALDKITRWLRSINDRKMPASNWLWFRVLVNLALTRSCGLDEDELRPVMERDLDTLDSFYLGHGWSSDGLWSEQRRQADYYSGSFAIQYSRLVYTRFCPVWDRARANRYKIEAADFASSFWRYFGTSGAAIPFGRSLTYRFAFVAFFSEAVVAGVDLPSPLDRLGVIKGIILRHLRWWARQGRDIFHLDGTLNIGYTYPNMYMSEDYNSPQSPYWCLKSFSVLGLPEQHEFWQCVELPHPLAPGSDPAPALPRVVAVAPPRHILCNTREHHLLLSSGQYTSKAHKAREAKYAKFAYSSDFAFSVPTGPLLGQMAPDSTLAVSADGESWRVPWNTYGVKFGEAMLDSAGTVTPVLSSTWEPWKKSDLVVRTTLVPVGQYWPGWHVRIHRLSWQRSSASESWHCSDGGFAISAVAANGTFLPHVQLETATSELDRSEGAWVSEGSCLIASMAGISGATDLGASTTLIKSDAGSPLKACPGRAVILKPDANTNLISQRTQIPTVQYRVGDRDHVILVTGVFAIGAETDISLAVAREMWRKRPQLELTIPALGDIGIKAIATTH